MENFAKRLAMEHKLSKKNSNKSPLKQLEKDFEFIKNAYKLLSISIDKGVPFSPSGEWILDNFYIVEEHVNLIRESFNIKVYKSLPKVEGNARIFVLLNSFVKYVDGKVDRDNIEKFLNAYQSQRNLTQKEIYEIPLMLQFALVHYISIVAQKIIIEQLQKFKVESLVERTINKKESSLQKFKGYKNINLTNQADAYVEHLVYVLKKIGKRGLPYLDVLEKELQKMGTTSNEIIRAMHFGMAVRRVSVGNAILSLKNLLRIDFPKLFEEVSCLEKILLQENSYNNLDEETRELYRNKISTIAKKTKTSEIYVADKLRELVSDGKYDMSEFLFGDFRDVLLNKLDFKERRIRPFSNTNKGKLFLYLLAIYLPTLIISVTFGNGLWWILFIPVSEMLVTLVNKIVTRFVPPKRIPRVDKIDDTVNTFVIVPTLLNSASRVKKMFENIELYYLNNSESNLLFCLLGDASEEKTETVKHDESVANTGIAEAERLNKKYNKEIFFFAYRSRVYSKTQDAFLGYERKRGMIQEFNSFLLEGKQGTFKVNTIKNIPEIKYVITLDADTYLYMESAKKLIGAMEHPYNKPIIKDGVVIKGYGIIQPKIDLTLEASNASVFSKIYAGNGGVDIYTTAESNVYQDVFNEAIFTGKGIYNLKVFDEVLKNEVPENLVLSHDLLESCYARAGLASDVKFIDGFPSKVNSYFLRLHRWIRGDWQIISWLKNKKINALSKYKILDNLRRSVIDIFLLGSFFAGFFYIPIIIIFSEVLFGIKRKTFETREQLRDTFLRSLINLIFLPYKAVLEMRAIAVTLYRLMFSKKKLLEWVTADDAERLLKNDLRTYIKEMIICPEIGLALIATTLLYNPLSLAQTTLLFLLWYAAPFVAVVISTPQNEIKQPILEERQENLLSCAEKTWSFFNENMTRENNFLIPDNYDEQRKNKLVNYTSSTNIGLSLLAIISAENLGFISKEYAIDLIYNVCNTIAKLKKWNGHLLNWYNIKTLEAVGDPFVSTVDSGNFVAYMFVLKEYLRVQEENEKTKLSLEVVTEIINNTDFSKLFAYDKNLFSIGFNINENKLVDSYYDLLASEARTASFVAIAKKDISYKHWFYLSRTTTRLKEKQGLLSWSGTMFEYLMPNVVMPDFKNSLLDNSNKFCVYAQKEYARKHGVPWGISEAAYNLKDLNYNYQYKAFGVPWIGLKRGLEEDLVVTPYATVLAMEKDFESGYRNLEELEQYGLLNDYGFYESIDFTPNRTINKKYELVRTHMAHHQGLILAMLNNILNDNILKKYFVSNTEIKAAKILLQEKMTSQNLSLEKRSNKIKKMVYTDFEQCTEKVIHKPSKIVNILNNENYFLFINDIGEGYSKVNNFYISKYKKEYPISNLVYIKNMNSGEYWSTTYLPTKKKPGDYEVKFMPYQAQFFRRDDELETSMRVMVSAEDNVEIKEVTVKNVCEDSVEIKLMMYLEVLLSTKESYIAHPAYNGMFLSMEEREEALIVKRKMLNGDLIYCAVFGVNEHQEKHEFVIDKMQIVGRCRDLSNPKILEEDILQKEISNTTTPAIAMVLNTRLESNESKNYCFYIAYAENESELMNLVQKYKSIDKERILKLAMSRSIIENRFYGLKGKDINLYNLLLSKIMFFENEKRESSNKEFAQSQLWKFSISGDLPIILVDIKSIKDIIFVKQLIDAIEYFGLKKVRMDLVIVVSENEKESYIENKVKEYLYSKNIAYLLNVDAGVHILNKNRLSADDTELFGKCANIKFDASKGSLEDQLEGGDGK